MKQIFAYLLIGFLYFGTTNVVLAQQQRGNKGDFAKKTEMFIKKQTEQMSKILMLDDKTTSAFSEVYKKYLLELQACQTVGRKKCMEIGKQRKEQYNDADVEKLIQIRFEQSRKILDVREKYYIELKKVLTPKQIMRIYSEEKSNKMRIMKEIEHRKGKNKR